MTTLPPKLAAGMLSRGNYKSIARATTKAARPRRDKSQCNTANVMRAFVESCRTRPKTIVFLRK